MEEYITVLHASHFEYEERKSVFIGEAMPVSTEKDALDFLQTVKKKYPDARHHVFAYLLREDSLMRFSDDHEPQGTAGMPVLDAIRKKGCTDVIVVVTRYFGGTLLGTGGLVRSYTEAAVGALDAAQIVTYATYCVCECSLSYVDYQKFGGIAERHGFRIDSGDFGETVTVYGAIRKDALAAFSQKIADATCGRAKIGVLEEIFSY